MFGHVFRVLIYMLLYENMTLLHEKPSISLYIYLSSTGVLENHEKAPVIYIIHTFIIFIKEMHAFT
jgi:hypothetical protein